MNLTDQLLQESENRIEKIGKFKNSSEFPWKRDRHGKPMERKQRGICIFNGYFKKCPEIIYNNVDSSKILTCGSCVQLLLCIPRETKIKLKEYFLERDLTDQARSVQSFIVEEEIDGELRTTIKRERIGKVTRNVNRRIVRVSKTRVSVDENRQKNLLL